MSVVDQWCCPFTLRSYGLWRADRCWYLGGFRCEHCKRFSSPCGPKVGGEGLRPGRARVAASATLCPEILDLATRAPFNNSASLGRCPPPPFPLKGLGQISSRPLANQKIYLASDSLNQKISFGAFKNSAPPGLGLGWGAGPPPPPKRSPDCRFPNPEMQRGSRVARLGCFFGPARSVPRTFLHRYTTQPGPVDLPRAMACQLIAIVFCRFWSRSLPRLKSECRTWRGWSRCQRRVTSMNWQWWSCKTTWSR